MHNPPRHQTMAPKVHKGNAIRMMTPNLHIAADKNISIPFFSPLIQEMNIVQLSVFVVMCITCKISQAHIGLDTITCKNNKADLI